MDVPSHEVAYARELGETVGRKLLERIRFLRVLKLPRLLSTYKVHLQRLLQEGLQGRFISAKLLCLSDRGISFVT